ncbi:O-antigen ligase family protein [Desulfobacterota bacterium M19]
MDRSEATHSLSWYIYRFSISKNALFSWGVALLLGMIVAGYPLVSNLPGFLNVESRIISVPFRAFVLLLSIALIISRVICKRHIYLGVLWFPLLVFWSFYFIRILLDTVLFPIPLRLDISEYYLFSIGVCFIPMVALMAWFDNDTQRKSFNLTVIIAAISSVLALYSVYLDYISGDTYNSVEVGRMALKTLNPISMGHLGVSLAILCVFYFVSKRTTSLINALLFALMLVLGVFVALAGASRGPILALVIVLLYYFFHSLKKKISLKSLLFAPLFFFLLYKFATIIQANIGFNCIARFQHFMNSNAGVPSVRMVLYEDAWSQFIHNPVFGSALEELNSGFYPHNLIIESFMSTGLVGGIAFCTILILGLWSAVTIMRLRPSYGWVSLLFFQYVIGAQFSGSLYQCGTMWALLGAVIGLSIPLRLSERSDIILLTNL